MPPAGRVGMDSVKPRKATESALDSASVPEGAKGDPRRPVHFHPIKPLPLPSDQARTATVFRGAFVVTPGSLRALSEMLRSFVAGPASEARVTVAVRSTTSEEERFDSIEPVCALRNPQGTPIRAITIDAMAGQSRAQVQVQAAMSTDFAAIRLFAHHPDADRVSGLVGKIKDESQNIRDRWNHWHRVALDTIAAWLVRHLRRVLLWIWLIWFLVFAVPLAFQARAYFASSAERAKSDQRTLHAAPQEPVKAMSDAERRALQERVASLQREMEESKRREMISQLSQIGTSFLLAFVACAASIAYVRMFPRAIFAIGEGGGRFERLSKFRFYIFGSIVGSGFLIPMVRDWAVRLVLRQ